MNRLSLKDIVLKSNKRKLLCLTAYTSSISKIIDNFVDIILIGDSVGSALYGMKNTQSVSLDMMKNHGKTVTQTSKKAFTIIDMPYGSYRNKSEALSNAKNKDCVEMKSNELATTFETSKTTKYVELED